MKAIGYITTLIGSIAITSTWKGYVLSILWEWFIVNTFNLPLLSVPVAIGITLMMTFLTSQVKQDDDSKFNSELIIKGLMYGLLMPALFLLVGWIVTWFI